MQNHSAYSIKPLSEQAVVIQFDSAISKEILTRVLNYQEILLTNKFPGLIEIVPSYCSITVYYDLIQVHQSALQGNSAFEKVKSYLNSLDEKQHSLQLNVKHHSIPVCYDVQYGVDLPELSETLHLSVDEIISLHTRNEYAVYLIGFTPGFPYMGILPDSLVCNRKNSPRKKVPRGSVAIAGKQTGIYPFETPGGWQIIGRTAVNLFSVERPQPNLFKPGDMVKFEAISLKEFEKLERA